MQTPSRGRKDIHHPPLLLHHHAGPPPKNCCLRRPYLIEYGILFSIQFLFLAIDLLLWVIGAHSLIAGFTLIFVFHGLIVLPAIFLPLLVVRVASWLRRLKDWGLFHKYDWNIAISVAGVVSIVISVLLVIYSQPLFFKWTHPTQFVGVDTKFEQVRDFSSFIFDPAYTVNMTMMGEKQSFPVGDPNGAGIYYSCFAPIIVSGTLGPNLFWAACPWQKQSCQDLAHIEGSCVALWSSSIERGITWTSDVEYLLHVSIQEQSQLWDMPPSPPFPILIRWENANLIYNEAWLVFWVTLLSGNLVIWLWYLIRRPFLRYFCGSFDAENYTQLN